MSKGASKWVLWLVAAVLVGLPLSLIVLLLVISMNGRCLPMITTPADADVCMQALAIYRERAEQSGDEMCVEVERTSGVLPIDQIGQFLFPTYNAYLHDVPAGVEAVVITDSCFGDYDLYRSPL